MINIGLINIVLGIPWWVFLIPIIIILAIIIYLVITSYFC